MKRFLFATITLLTICGGRLKASGIIDCSGSASAINTCVASKLPTFETRLDWGILGQSFGAPDYGGTWTAGLTGMTVDVKGHGIDTSNEGLRLAYNIGTVMDDGIWTKVGQTTFGARYHEGHFQGPSAPADSDFDTLKADPAIQLLGLSLNTTSANNAGLLFNFSNPFQQLGFYASAANNANFSLTLKIFDGANGTGNLLGSETFTYNSLSYQPGGNCTSYAPSNTAPVPCADAPFFFASGYNTGRSALVTTTDARGFYVSSLYIGGGSDVPEPGPMLLCGSGILLLAIGSRRKWRRKTSE